MTMVLPPAGGRATEAGMAFQASVATWFAAHLVAQAPIGGRFGLPQKLTPTKLQLETGRYLDDIEVELSNGGLISVQCKTKPSLSRDSESQLGSTISQLVAFAHALREDGKALDPEAFAGVLAIDADASARLDDLEFSLRYLDLGSTWRDGLAGLNRDRREALTIFAGHVKRAWLQRFGHEVGDEDIDALARIFHVVRFPGPNRFDELNSSRVLGGSILDDEAAGRAALPVLEQIVRRMMASGAPAGREGLIAALRRAGVEDRRHPIYEKDHVRLRQQTTDELTRLNRHTMLPLGRGVEIRRHFEADLDAAVSTGSLLVIGEPGAGKTGVLVAMAKRLLDKKMPCIFLSVDGFEGVGSGNDIDAALGLEHRLIDVLSAWPGSVAGVLIIDALDASRGGPAEAVFANLIETITTKLGGRWSVVASIRTFDLKNGTRFRRMMVEEPPNSSLSDPELPNVRHFLIPRLNEEERTRLGAEHPWFVKAINNAPLKLRALLENIFNLSLVADLTKRLAFGSLDSVRSQSDLIDIYEDLRLEDHDMVVAVAASVEVMLERRNLMVPRQTLTHPAVERVLRAGVLSGSSDLIGFSHHVLFDHVAGRYYLESFEGERLLQQLLSKANLGLLLGPALRFAVERMWRRSSTDAWTFIANLAATEGVDPVLSNIAMRSISELIEVQRDVDGVIAIIDSGRDRENLGKMLSRIARFARLSIGDASLGEKKAATWAAVVHAMSKSRSLDFADAARVILIMLHEKTDLSAASSMTAFGDAARAFLSYSWGVGAKHPALAVTGIRAVCASFSSSPSASRALLEHIFDREHFNEHAHEEVGWLAEGVGKIAPADPEFALAIYQMLFGTDAPQTGESWLGGNPSLILPLSTTKEQDYEHARWQLSRAFPKFLSSSPWHATVAVSAFVLGAKERHPSQTVTIEERDIEVVEDYKSLSEWRESRSRSTEDEGMLATFSTYLKSCSMEHFEACVSAAAERMAASSVWARLFGRGAERLDIARQALWPFASSLKMLQIDGLRRDALVFLAAAYEKQSREDRQRFETDLVGVAVGDDAWDNIAGRLFSALDRSALVTTAAVELFERLKASDRLVPNTPYSSFEIRSGTVDTDYLLERSGVSIGEGPNGRLRDLVRPLETLLRGMRQGTDATGITKIWEGIPAVIKAVDDLEVAEDSSRAAWAAVGEGIERIAESPDYDPSMDGHPDLDELLKTIDRLARSPYPKPKEQTDNDMMAWGNWDIRIYAATATMDLARRFGRENADLAGRLRQYLDDPVATVRLQVAQSINAIFDVDPAMTWELARIAADEGQDGVLAFFVSGPMHRLYAADPARCDAMLEKIMARVKVGDTSTKRQHRSLNEALGHLIAQLWVGEGHSPAKHWIDLWLSDVVRYQDLLWPLVSLLRSALFEKYTSTDAEGASMQDRARQIADSVLDQAAAVFRSLDPQDRSEAATSARRAADTLIDHVCSQLYFGSGAYENTAPDEVGLKDLEARHLFVSEYRDLLRKIADWGSPRTLHQLTELYEYLVDAAPAEVFDDMANLLLGPAADRNYHSESLASDGLVRLVRLYLADHRSLFTDRSERRKRLVEILELFSSAGSPETLSLLYDLPDLLR